MQELHILLDYFIDQEDRIGGDLNFCTYYNSQQEIIERFVYFLKKTDQAVSQLPDRHFHRMINRALLGVYLADKKVNEQIKRQNKFYVYVEDLPSFFFGTI